MQRLKNYDYDEGLPLTKPYEQKTTYNAYYKGLEKQTGKEVLISEYRQKQENNLNKRFKKLQKLKAVHHENLSQIYDVIFDKAEKRLFLILEWFEGGSLLQYKQKQTTFDYKVVLYIVREISKALKAIHDADIIHRFINLQNIEFDSKGKPKLTIKCLYYKSYYLSPEEKQNNKKKQNDIFSLGIVLHKLIYPQTPFKGNSVQQYKESVQEGVKYPKKGQQMFPKCSPTQVKYMINSMTAFKSEDRATCQQIISESDNILSKQIEIEHFSKGLTRKILKQKYIPFKIVKHSEEETLIIALNREAKEFVKINIYKGNNKDLKRYVEEKLQNFIKIQEFVGVMPIYEHKIIQNQYLMIVSFYDNQGSINEYFESGGTMTSKHSKQFIQKLTNRLKKFKSTHNHLTYDNVVIRKGNFYIKYPPFQTNQYKQNLQKNKDKIIMVAPQVTNGQSSDKSDTWSIAMFKYRLQHEGQMPKFDKFNKLIIPERKKKSESDIKFYEDYLVKDPEKRKNLTKEEDDIVKEEVRQKTNPTRVTKTKIKLQRKVMLEAIFEKLKVFLYLQNHWTKPIRVFIKCLISLLFYIFLFYFSMFVINGQLIAEHSIFQATTMEIRAFDTDNIPNINYTLVTKTPDITTTTFYNSTLTVLRDDYQCVLNDFSVQSNIQDILNRNGFTTYQVFGIILSVINLFLICLALSKMDFPKIYFICPMEEGNYNSLWSWVFINLAIASQTSFIYLIYGSLFHITLQPCISKPTLTAVQYLFKDWVFSFNIRFIWIYIGLLFSYAVIIFFVLRPNKNLHIGFKIGLFILYLMGVGCRALGGTGGDISGSKESVFGKCGQLLLLMTGILFLVLDFIFSCCIEANKTQEQEEAVGGRKKTTIEDSLSEIHHTQQPIA